MEVPRRWNSAGGEQEAIRRQQLALWVAPEEDAGTAETCAGLQGKEGFAHRTITPVRGLVGGGEPAADPEYDWAAEVAGEAKAVEIPEEERAWFSERYTLRWLYEHPVYGLDAVRRARVADAMLAAASVAKDRQALNRWERYSPRPGDWPAGEPWQGRPLAWITDEHVTATLVAMRRQLAVTTVRSTWAHLRTIFARAKAVRAIERVPEPTWGKAKPGDRAAKQLYDEGAIGRIWEALRGQLDLQVAFVVSLNVGLRTVDMFCLRWESLVLTADRPSVEFTARKTGKCQRVPLAEVTVRQLERWRRRQGLLFPECAGLVWPELTDATAADPERSRPARDRNARFKRAAKSVGMECEKPWQVGRLTCNERLERHRPGSGQFVLGHVATLNSTSYREPSGMVYEAVTTLPQPECFWEGIR